MLNRSTDILRDLVAFPSVSTASDLEMIGYLREFLERLGAQAFVTHDPTGAKANLFATLGRKRSAV